MSSSRVVSRLVRWLAVGLVSAVLGLAVPAVAHGQAGRILSISPSAAAPGEPVTITGQGFGASNVRVTVAGVPAQVIQATGGRVTFLVPTLPAGRVTVQASNPGGRAGTIAFQVQAITLLDAAAAVTSVVGSRGGVLETVSQGVAYRLTIPAGAVAADQRITVTPLRGLVGLPFDGPVAAAVRLSPSGLQFARPASLTIGGLPLSPASSEEPHGWLGFVASEDAASVEVQPVVRRNGALVLKVPHFSDSGVVDTRLSTFTARFGPVLAAFPANASAAQAVALVSQLLAYLQEFGVQVCGQTTLCGDAFLRADQALMANIDASLAEVAAFIQLGDPVRARLAVRPILELGDHLSQIAMLAEATGSPIQGQLHPSLATSLLDAPLRSIIGLAVEQATDAPNAVLFLLLLDLSADAQVFGLPAVSGAAIDGLTAALEALLVRADGTCAIDPAAGDALLDIALVSAGDDLLQWLQGGGSLDSRFRTVRAACPIQVFPQPASLPVRRTLQLTGSALGYTPGILTWAIEGSSVGHTISPDGLLTAGDVATTISVVATSVADPSRYRTVPVEIVPITVAVSPAAAEIRVGETVQFSAAISGVSGTVRWSASGGSIDPVSGLFTGTSAGAVTVIATLDGDSASFGTATVNVRGTSNTLSGTITAQTDITYSNGTRFQFLAEFTAVAQVAADGTLTLLSATGTTSQSTCAATGYVQGGSINMGSGLWDGREWVVLYPRRILTANTTPCSFTTLESTGNPVYGFVSRDGSGRIVGIDFAYLETYTPPLGNGFYRQTGALSP